MADLKKRREKVPQQSQRFKYNPELAVRNFNLPLDEYRLANWNKKEFFLPTMVVPEPGTLICEELIKIIEAKDAARLRVMLHAGVPVNVPLNDQKTTMLHLATRAKDEITCRLLLSFGADPDMRDENREMPWELARKLGLGHIICLFEEEENRRKEATARPSDEAEDPEPGDAAAATNQRRSSAASSLPGTGPQVRTRLRAREPNFMGE